MPQFIDQNKVTAAFSSPFPLSFEELREHLREQQYDRPTDGVARARLSEAGQPIPLERIVKGPVNVIYDEQKGFLAVECESSIEDLLKEMEMVFSIAAKLPSIAASPLWYEVNFVCRNLGTKHPLSSEAEPSKATQLFENAAGLKPKHFSRSICSFSGDLPNTPLNKIIDWVHMTVGVFVPNPRYYQMRIICRRSELDATMKFYKSLPSLIEELSDPDVWRE